MNTATRDWIKSHGAKGIVLPSEVKDLQAGAKRVYQLMQDGKFYTPNEIDKAAGKDGVPAREGLRRMRDLRPFLNEHGFEIHKERIGGSRLYRYCFRKMKENSNKQNIR